MMESYGRSGTLMPTAIRCAMQGGMGHPLGPSRRPHQTGFHPSTATHAVGPPHSKGPQGSTQESKASQRNSEGSTFTPGQLQRAVTSLEREDINSCLRSKNHGGSTQRPESLLLETERKRKSDPSSSSRKNGVTSIKEALLGVGSGDGLFGRLGSGRSASKKLSVESPASTSMPGTRKTFKAPHGGATATFYTRRKSPSPTPLNVSKDAHKNGVSRHPTTSKHANTSKGSTSKASSDTKSHHTKATPEKGESARKLSVPMTNDSLNHSRSRRRKSTRKRFFGRSSQCTGQPLEGSTTEEECGGEEVDGGVDKKWTRSNSLRRHFQGRHNGGRQQDPSAHSDTEISAPHSLLDGECGSVGGSVTSERAIDVGRVEAWATSFEKLLEDPAGLHTFAEFLKKEYSHENIYFWTACERYKRLTSPEELRTKAKEIFERHLYSGAPEPVNVDSQARQDAQDGLHNPSECLFAQAQKQIFNLMKFDSYSRFLKSSLYQDCVGRDMRGQTLPYPGGDALDPDLRIAVEDSHVKLKKSRSDADERRRKSLLPWNRKDRSKSKDRGEAEYRRKKKQGQRHTSDSSSLRSDISGSRTSLNSSDLALGRRAASRESLTSGDLGSLSGSEGYNRCRVILPDLSNSVVAVKNDETIQDLMTRLLERRGLVYSTFDVYHHKTDKMLNKKEDSCTIGGIEVRLEQRVLFQLDLPSQKTVCVKAKPTKVTGDVLRPILLKYGFKLDLMYIHKIGEEKGINLKAPITDIDGDRLMVQTKEEVKEWGLESGRQKKRGNNNTLDEITNRVFEDLRNGKFEQHFDELGVMDFDARSSRTDSSDKSSGILGGFSRRNSLGPEKDSNNKPRKSRASVHENLSMLNHPDHALITKRRGPNQASAKQENDELYEGLKRAQRSRLDDQRGTEINFELPDFLKCDQPQDKENQHHLADQLLAHLECSFPDGVLPSPQQAQEYFSLAHPEVWGGLPSSPPGLPPSANATLLAPDLDIDDFDDTLRGDELCQVSDVPGHSEVPDFDGGTVPPRVPLAALPLSPPPLPPKPKVGGAGRGPPPRPPSRQLHLLNPPPSAFPPPPPPSSSSAPTSDDEGLIHPEPHHPPLHITRQSHDKFNISFV